MRCHLHHHNLRGMKINLAGSNLRNLKKSKYLTDQSAVRKDQQLAVRGPTAEPLPEEERHRTHFKNNGKG